MSFLQKITSGKVEKPFLILIYGTDGVGKTSFAAQAPKPVFLGPEKGNSLLDVSRFPTPKSFGDVQNMILEMTTAKHEFKTLVIDSLDWIEPLIWEAVCKENGANSIENVGGGYGKGYAFAIQKWMLMRDALDNLRETKGLNIILIAHSHIKTFQDPQNNTAYDRHQLKLNDKAAALWREFVDTVLFATFEVHTKGDDKKAKAYGDGSRVMFTERRPAFDAKNRLGLPFRLALSFAELVSASSTPRSPQDAQNAITGLLANVTDQSLKEKVTKAMTDAGTDLQKLQNIENKLKTMLGA